MANKNQYNWTPHEVAEARKALLSYYADEQNIQVTRLIGFVVGLFTLLQLALVSKVPKIMEVTGFLPWFWNWKDLFLFIGTAIILYFILRVIFRYSFFGYLSSNLFIVTVDDAKTVAAENNYESKLNEFLAFNLATTRKVYEDTKLFWLPSNLFFTAGDKKCPSRERWGVKILAIISVVLTFLIIYFLW
jgi:hypothetical protein